MRAVAALGLGLGALGSGALVTSGFATGGDALPDFTPSLPNDTLSYVDFTAPGWSGRPLLRFDTVINNVGSGAFEGYRDPSGRLWQIVYGLGGARAGLPTLTPDAGVAPAAPGANNVNGWIDLTAKGGQTTFAGDQHNHWHIQQIAKYELRTPGGATVGTAAKVGFCIYDSEGGANYKGWTKASDNWCQHPIASPASGGPSAPVVRWGLSPVNGADIYGRDLPAQWVDLTDIPPGGYGLVATVNPNNLLKESNTSNNSISRGQDVPGIAAQAASGGVVRSGAVDVELPALPAPSFDGENVLVKYSAAAPITYAAARVKKPGYAYGIVQGPAHGVIGSEDGDGVFTYTPEAGYVGPDSFTYEVSDNVGFTSVAKTVSITVASASVSPSFPRIETGQSQQFAASLSGGLSGSVIWSVDGAAGGNATVGTITPGGLYAAPSTKGSHLIRATSAVAPAVFGETTVDVGVSPSVAITPTAASVNPGGTVPLSATVTDGPPALAWSVNGVAGGSAALGTVSPSGTYTAPATAPGAPVAVRAAMAGRPQVFAEATITVAAPPSPAPPTQVTRVTTPRPTVKVVGRTRTGVRLRITLDRAVPGTRVLVQARLGRRAFKAWTAPWTVTGRTITVVVPLKGRKSLRVRALVLLGPDRANGPSFLLRGR